MKSTFSIATAIIIFILFCSIHSYAQPVKRELRAAWIATYSNIDWPQRSHTPQQQRDAFIKIIDQHKATGINAVYVQIRSQSDAMYPSPYEPWSADLTGVQGQPPNPLWDPLNFMITECHRRGIEFHAWLNPYRVAGTSSNLSTFSSGHVSRQHPQWLLRSGTKVTLNPGLLQVREHILKVISDIVNRYDIDGIHFDDYFYPEFGFNDDASYTIDPRGIAVRADWRRDNVNLLIKDVAAKINQLKPWVKFGVSPSGIYRNSSDNTVGSPTKGMEHYSVLYADTKKWLQEGWVDYIEPQVYWYMGQPAADYNQLIPWWNMNSYGRHIYIGIAGYKVESWGRTPWSDIRQIPNQLRLNRKYLDQNIKGTAFYNTSSMDLNLLGFRDSLKNSFYRTPAIVPAMPWKDSIPPNPPYGLNAVAAGEEVTLNWQRPSYTDGELNRPRQYVIYRSTEPVIDTEDAEKIIAITTDTSFYKDTSITAGVNYYYAVAALDRLYNESTLSNIDNLGKQALPITLINIQIKTINDKEIQLDWSTAQERGLASFVAEKSRDKVNFKSFTLIPATVKSGNKYMLIDKVDTFNAPVYYRIKMVDSLGKETYSRVLSQVVSKEQMLVRLNTRIPKTSDLQVGVLVNGPIEYAILDEERRKVTWGKIKPFPLNTQVILPGTKNLPPGNYVINIKYGNLQQIIHLPVM